MKRGKLILWERIKFFQLNTLQTEIVGVEWDEWWAKSYVPHSKNWSGMGAF
jgi:hypothetical protein